MRSKNRLIGTLLVFTLLNGCATPNVGMEVFPMGTMQADKLLDMRGKLITTYILYHAVEALQTMNEGDVLEIVTDTFEAVESDMYAWSRHDRASVAGCRAWRWLYALLY